MLHKTQMNSVDIENCVSDKVPQGTEAQGGFTVYGIPAGIAFISRHKGYQFEVNTTDQEILALVSLAL